MIFPPLNATKKIAGTFANTSIEYTTNGVPPVEAMPGSMIRIIRAIRLRVNETVEKISLFLKIRVRVIS
ncbi:MAG: hypothetical protein GWN86_18990 [Desulfobacterales bacterium]|nr:hypothetical protein [Desulfobacterales bacterium]